MTSKDTNPEQSSSLPDALQPGSEVTGQALRQRQQAVEIFEQRRSLSSQDLSELSPEAVQQTLRWSSESGHIAKQLFS